MAQLNGAVVVTNSLAQLERLAKLGQGIEPIASLDEFKFFRTRYPLGDKDETAFLFIERCDDSPLVFAAMADRQRPANLYHGANWPI